MLFLGSAAVIGLATRHSFRKSFGTPSFHNQWPNVACWAVMILQVPLPQHQHTFFFFFYKNVCWCWGKGTCNDNKPKESESARVSFLLILSEFLSNHVSREDARKLGSADSWTWGVSAQWWTRTRTRRCHPKLKVFPPSWMGRAHVQRLLALSSFLSAMFGGLDICDSPLITAGASIITRHWSPKRSWLHFRKWSVSIEKLGNHDLFETF